MFRSAIQWQDLENRYGKQKLGRRVSTSARISQNAAQCCADFSILNYILHLFPIITWIRKYSVKEDLLHDIIAGLTISVLHIPQGMAYGLLAGVSPIAGLYVSFFPVIIYSIMGTSQHVSIGKHHHFQHLHTCTHLYMHLYICIHIFICMSTK